MFENVTIKGDAILSNDIIQITPNKIWKVSQATYKDPFHLGDQASERLTDFNTYFFYNWAGSMGLPIMQIDPLTWTPFVAVEFDTFPNAWDPSEIHVGININSLESNATIIWYNNITYGRDNEAWISYDSSSKNLSVVFTGYINNTRFKSVLSWPINLRDYLSE
ncbi:hypothetical protein LOK49_LG11G01602 [Camellia lanceoleosa]|uniref:Uncharacterized protein n=1 Tax=Camellia lanceoleosa TaxID=1840588 RepID=A0ACC0G4R0_9ERIC|nr:hypothetical protein LOK49_LG11G01602 [Camellia lanceoleosa]